MKQYSRFSRAGVAALTLSLLGAALGVWGGGAPRAATAGPIEETIELFPAEGRVSARCQGRGRKRVCKVTARVTIANDGELDAPATKLQLFASRDDVRDDEDKLFATIDVPAIPAGGEKTVSVKNKRLTKGYNALRKHIIVVVDAKNAADEGDEEDNEAAYGPIR